jgi:molecular chaperone DnaK (HSP70)
MEKLGAIGIDIGSRYSTICTVKGGVIETVLNESSGRNSPTVIGFCPAERLISDAAV